jgi:hypothetical protein
MMIMFDDEVLARILDAGYDCRMDGDAVIWYRTGPGRLGVLQELARLLGSPDRPHWAAGRLAALAAIRLGRGAR